jgi:hypothetical protein
LTQKTVESTTRNENNVGESFRKHDAIDLGALGFPAFLWSCDLGVALPGLGNRQGQEDAKQECPNLHGSPSHPLCWIVRSPLFFRLDAFDFRQMAASASGGFLTSKTRFVIVVEPACLHGTQKTTIPDNESFCEHCHSAKEIGPRRASYPLTEPPDPLKQMVIQEIPLCLQGQSGFPDIPFANPLSIPVAQPTHEFQLETHMVLRLLILPLRDQTEPLIKGPNLQGLVADHQSFLCPVEGFPWRSHGHSGTDEQLKMVPLDSLQVSL